VKRATAKATFGSSRNSDQLAACAPRARGICFVCRWRAKPQSRPRYSCAHSETKVRPCFPISTRQGVIRSPRSDSGPLVTARGLELSSGILGEKPQALEGLGRLKCACRSPCRSAKSAGKKCQMFRIRTGNVGFGIDPDWAARLLHANQIFIVETRQHNMTGPERRMLCPFC
jgi:hypothetical protein